jgi:hypothetical protein
MKNSQNSRSRAWLAADCGGAMLSFATAAVLSASLVLMAPSVAAATKNGTSTHSTTIALTSDEEQVVVVNREANSISIIKSKIRTARTSVLTLLKSVLARSLAASL